MRSPWWRSFFKPAVFPIDDLVSPEHTAAEVRELLRLLPPPPARVLDVACGTGRHAVALARRGYAVTGVDQSAPYLARARRRAREAGAEVRFLRRDMRRLGFEGGFDAAVNLWTSFGYLPTPAADVAALRGMRRALEPGGRLLLEVIDGDWLRRNLLARDWQPAGGGFLLEASALREGEDPAVVTERVTLLPGARPRRSTTVVRRYDAARLSAALGRAGFERVAVRGGLLEPRALPGFRRRILAVAWRQDEARRMRP